MKRFLKVFSAGTLLFTLGTLASICLIVRGIIVGVFYSIKDGDLDYLKQAARLCVLSITALFKCILNLLKSKSENELVEKFEQFMEEINAL